MASRLSPTPDSETPDLTNILARSTSGKSTTVPAHVRKDVAKRKSKESPADKFTQDSDIPVTEEQYRQLMSDRPKKFGPKMTGFIRGGGSNGSPCSHCVHFYNSPIAAKAMGKPTHATCEVVRFSDSEDEIKPEDTCRLYSENGIDLPLLNKEASEEK